MANEIPPEARERYPEIPWQQMAAMRDKLIHEYFVIDLEVERRTLKHNLPPFQAQVARV